MKIHLVSDIHAEFCNYPYGAPSGTDVIVAAGDISSKASAPSKLVEWFGDKIPILYIPGNHEYYHSLMSETKQFIQFECNRFPNVYYLDEKHFEIDEVMFIGGTFWSDFKLYKDKSQKENMQIAQNGINDFRLINISSDIKFSPFNAEKINKKTKKHFKDWTMAYKSPDRKIVFITHFLPHPNSIDEQYVGNELNPYFCSDQTKLINELKPNLWLHGHTHCSFDYTVGSTRVVCNPRGYCHHMTPFHPENQKFNPNLLIEI